ncbi:MAG TPA: phosphoribosyltransferase [Candidatus Yonathbacteria bacterium]|nr:phosphoribosyltransferase [Candidatus Yonathbacteria bacterium]
MTIFKNRIEAGKKLAERLAEFKETNAIILALPRGGIITGAEVAHALDLPLDIIVTRKIGAPGNEEYAIGAIDIEGTGVFSESEAAYVDKEWLNKEITKEKQEAERRWQEYRGTRGPLELVGKTVVIVDDGIATGMTMKAAVRYAKKLGAQNVIVAVPVAPQSTVAELKQEVDVRTLETPVLFFAVGQFYEDFPQISDQEVIRLLS